jgi:hypothetical protein
MIMNPKILSFACLSMLAVFRSTTDSVAADPVETPVPASVQAADREFLAALETGATVNPAPAQPATVAPVTREVPTSKAVAVTKKPSGAVNREEVPKKTAAAKTSAPSPKAPKAKRTAPTPKTEVVEVRRAIPVERTTVVTTVKRHDSDDDDEEDEDEDRDEKREEARERDTGFLSRLFSR